ncbi:hypothetical protein EGT36_21345 [Agrobacterium sp. FDAARGOS_525]|uniref:hypothetical protein n=1 Tax=Agrobacterium sp. FDAARGOS_525 TaxID=2420311 RepID=UPI000F67F7CE|nr:hypothetical protein [Agrobacterium sp. FDAARGOS_525]RSC31222.1 hypothetical protein EGT36_21345 [Agrobacterium sp. FDAARGOS_525]
MTDIASISELLAIAERAIEVSDRETARKEARENLNAAYDRWKEANGIDHVETDSAAWDIMMGATESEYALLTDAQSAEKNAKRRLATAIRRYRHG